MSHRRIHIEVAYALPERQKILALLVEPGTTIGEAIEQSGIKDHFEGLEISDDMVGIFGHRKSLDEVLSEGDRVEIYRPLIADPKEVRRERARGGSG